MLELFNLYLVAIDNFMKFINFTEISSNTLQKYLDFIQRRAALTRLGILYHVMPFFSRQRP
jgi:hypothetical protein